MTCRFAGTVTRNRQRPKSQRLTQGLSFIKRNVEGSYKLGAPLAMAVFITTFV